MPRSKAIRSKGNKFLFLLFAPGAFANDDKLPELKSASTNWPTSMIDASNYDDEDFLSRITGDQDFTLTASMNFIKDNALQQEISDAKLAGDDVYVLYVEGDAIAAGAKNTTYMFAAAITDFSSSDGEVITRNLGLQALEKPVIDYDVTTFPTYT